MQMLPARKVTVPTYGVYDVGMATETIGRKLFTADEFFQMFETKILPEEDKFELIRGEIIEMPRPGPLHNSQVWKLHQLFTLRFGTSVLVITQGPIVLDKSSVVLPDLTFLKPRRDFYSERNPSPDDVLLAIEISHTTLSYDTKVKAPLYAEAVIPEYWILDLTKNVLL